MSSPVLSTTWRISTLLKRPGSKGIIASPWRLNFSNPAAKLFEPIPREEMVTKFKSRLQGRKFLPGSSEGGFPEFLAEPRESFPLAVRVNNWNQSSLTELTAKCMEYVDENILHSPAILFRGLPAKTGEDFSIIAQTIQNQFCYDGGTGYRTTIDKQRMVTTASEEPSELSIYPHNEMSYARISPARVRYNGE